ncbi:MAG TPA: hypothetical protein VK656_02500 [Candidatus Acidoferrum sp.]|nr:hypothetical protein [Candidatus Acidoferrum sp.]
MTHRPTVFGRAFGSRGRTADGTDERRRPVWLYGAAIGIGLAVVAFVVVMLFPRSGAGSPPRPPGVPFEGDGYSIALPSEYQWVHVATAAGDDWNFQPVGGTRMSIRAALVRDLQPAEQTLEGALGRMESQTPLARRPFAGSPTSLALPAGPAYRVVDSAGFVTYVFFKAGRAIFLEFEGVARADEDAVTASVTFK